MPIVLEKIKEKFGAAVLDTHSFRGDDTALIAREKIVEAAKFLKEDPELDFNVLIDLTAVDCLKLDRPHRFEVVYHFYSIAKKHRARLKVPLTEEDPSVDTLTGLWPGANWFEREVWDMFGVKFNGHPNLQRILMYDEFEGHALRKDYPVRKRQPLVGPEN